MSAADVPAPGPSADPLAWPDLADAVTRARWFGGQSPSAVAAAHPIAPLDHPALPPVPPALVTYGLVLGDPETPKAGRPAVGPALCAAVRTALYLPGVTVPMADADGEVVPVPFVPPARPARGRAAVVVLTKSLSPADLSANRPLAGPGAAEFWRAWDEAGLPPRGVGPVGVAAAMPFVIPGPPGSRVPGAWAKAGHYLLMHYLVTEKPDWVLALGADAVKALFGAKAKLSDHLGGVTHFGVGDGHVCRVVAAESPYKAQDPAEYAGILSACRMLGVRSGLSAQAAPQEVPADYRAVYTMDQFLQAVADAERGSADGGYLSIDCEWDGRHPSDPGAYLYTVQFSWAPGQARCVFLRRCGGGANTDLPWDVVRPHLDRLIGHAPDRRARLVGHNMKADFTWLAYHGIDLSRAVAAPVDDPDPAAPGGRFAHQKTYTDGPFDTYVACHVTDELGEHGLEMAAATRLGVERWDLPVVRFLDDYCVKNKVKKRDLTGYGCVPEDVIAPYGMLDVDMAGRLYLQLNGDPRAGTRGTLDADRFKLSTREPYYLHMYAYPVWAEIEQQGLEVDRDRHADVRNRMLARRAQLMAEIREQALWPTLNFGSAPQLREFLFGEGYAKKPAGPPGCLRLYLDPYKATDTTGDGRLWADALSRAAAQGLPRPDPATDSETLTALASKHPLVHKVYAVRTLGTALNRFFRPPDADLEEDDGEADGAGGGEETFSRGLLRAVNGDGRVRTMLGLAETGRLRSSRENLQNVGSSVDDRYNRVMGYGDKDPQQIVVRSVFRARPGWWLVSADLMGAEIAVAGWMSGDPLLIEHAARANLPDGHPDKLDLHCDLAVRAFRLAVAPTKDAFKAANLIHLRKAAKPARFGLYYGASPETIWRQALLEDPTIQLADIEALCQSHNDTYPRLSEFFGALRKRPRTPGYAVGPYGNVRRFPAARDRQWLAKQEREAQNFGCQAPVAFAMDRACGNAYRLREAWGLLARFVLTVHDSLVVETPTDELATVVDHLLPMAMVAMNPVFPTDTDGRPTGAGPYRFGIDVEVGRRWGEDVKEAVWRAEAAAARKVAAA